MIETGFDNAAMVAGMVVVLLAVFVSALFLAGWAVLVRILEA